MEFIGIIPARYASTRFPTKPLAILGGKTVIQRVYEQVSSVLDNVCVATDDDRIHEAVEAFGGRVVMTSANHKSGTDRICEAYNKLYPNTSSSPHRGKATGGRPLVGKGQEESSSISRSTARRASWKPLSASKGAKIFARCPTSILG